jgi:hypothetical protein
MCANPRDPIRSHRVKAVCAPTILIEKTFLSASGARRFLKAFTFRLLERSIVWRKGEPHTSSKWGLMMWNTDLPKVKFLAQGFAMCAHRNQRRKYEDAPYVVHCERVARMVAEYTTISMSLTRHLCMMCLRTLTSRQRKCAGCSEIPSRAGVGS